MKLTALELEGAFLVEPVTFEDERGSFSRAWDRETALAHGVDVEWVQYNLSTNKFAGTLRGMHYQFPRWEAKLVRVVRGALYDVIVDIREGSPTRGQWVGYELSAANKRALYVPPGFAHGFLTLEDETDLYYQMSDFYVPEQASGIRFDDPALGIDWPGEAKIMSDRDRELPGWSA